jgi:hypothetical protein
VEARIAWRLAVFIISLPQTRALRRQVKVLDDQLGLLQFQAQLAQDEAERARQRSVQLDNDQIAIPVLRLAANLIAPATLECSLREAKLFRMDSGRKVKEIYVLGDPHVWGELHSTIDKFLMMLVRYKEGKASLETAEIIRQEAASKLRALVPSVRGIGGQVGVAEG